MLRILIVDDSASTRAFLRAALEADAALAPLEIVEASSGFDALRLLPRGPYDLVMTDINMPDINGFELVQFMRQSDRHRDTPIVIVSTQSSERERARGFSLGANEFLGKPLSPAAVTHVVEKLFAARRSAES